MRKIIRKIQGSHETVKTRWVWGLTVAGGTLVVGLWLVYLNLTVERVNYETVVDRRPAPSSRAVFQAGLQTMTQRAFASWRMMMRRHSFTFAAPERRFSYQSLEPVQPVALP